MTRDKATGRTWMGNAKGHKALTDFYKELKDRIPPEALLKLEGPIRLELTVGVSAGLGDLSNLLKSVEDGFTKVGLWKDDRYVDELVVKRVKVARGWEFFRASVRGYLPNP
jgi:Holliday junction resolvase RusA-like endonuclease